MIIIFLDNFAYNSNINFKNKNLILLVLGLKNIVSSA